MLTLTVVLVATTRLLAVLVTAVLATVGSWVLGFGVMTACTSTTSECTATSLLLGAGWLLQGGLLVVAVALWVPRVARRVTRPALGGIALGLAVVSVLGFAGTAWAAERSYCPGEDATRDYCDVRAAPTSSEPSPVRAAG